MDVARASDQIDAMIERRALQASAEQDAVEDLWRESTRIHREQIRRENRAAWYAFHMGQADRIRRTMTVLVEHHEARASALLDEGRV